MSWRLRCDACGSEISGKVGQGAMCIYLMPLTPTSLDDGKRQDFCGRRCLAQWAVCPDAMD